MKGKPKMKRSILAILILAVALLTGGNDRERVARADGTRNLPADSQVPLSDDPQTSQELTEEFHQTYPLNATGRVSIENINGGVRISVWDQNEVKVDAVKRAYKKQRLDEAKVDVSSTPDSHTIRTKHPSRNQSLSDGEPHPYHTPST